MLDIRAMMAAKEEIRSKIIDFMGFLKHRLGSTWKITLIARESKNRVPTIFFSEESDLNMLKMAIDQAEAKRREKAN